ncbi:MAG: asparagine synthase (glutamine-hydrolyzing) [Chloroflexi bacterium]|nr:asparagine synthase (glutamine-hydrolyzing) [Chloroflexota bacterium]
MCGICGWVSVNEGLREGAGEILRAMSLRLAHRGPDSDGFYLDERAALGFRRLSIIDLSTGDQPIGNEDGSAQIIFNGEAYNYQALRPELERKGHVFRTQSDTETILHAYEEYGEGCVERLRGMFALAIWDAKRRRLFLARDRMGKKPLYYYWNGRELLFASELKALLAHPTTPREMDAQAVDEYLMWHYINAPRSILKGVKKLPPGHWLSLDSESGELCIARYWQLEYTPKLLISEAEAAERLHAELTEAVRLRLISDVPLGALLSGGVDSSIVVGLMASLSSTPVKTFTIGFEESAYDEAPYARQVAQRFATDHHELVVRPQAAEIMPDLVWYLDEPMADPSALPTYYVAQMARRYVTVALNGDGGDEAFGGYTRYANVLAYRRYAALPGWLRKGVLEAALARLPAGGSEGHPIERIRRGVRYSRLSLEEQYTINTCLFHGGVHRQLFSSEFKQSLNGATPAYAEGGGLGALDWMLQTDNNYYLPGDLLVKMDRMSMAHSLEARSPFLDHEVVGLAARMPDNYKLRGGVTKRVLKLAFKDLIPMAWMQRRKQGFGAPLAAWLRGELRPLGEELLPGAARRGIFDARQTETLWQRHQSGQQDLSHQLWALMVLELWQRRFLDEAGG